MGGVLIVEYHRIAKNEARWDRSVAAFRKDLERLYRMGFLPVTLTQYLDDRMDLPPGASPVVFTFDDSHPSQLRFLDDGSIDPNCAVGIWQAFAREHPDFPVRATFFVLPPSPWGQPRQVAAKLKLLQQLGCEVGSHTYSHANLGKLSPSQAEAELVRSSGWIEREFGRRPEAIALPYGVSPKDPSLLRKAGFRCALLVGAGPAPSPDDPKRNLLRLPRVQAIDGPYGLTDWLDRIEAGKVKPYVAP
ncbi:MAG: polysaccharide deacetylase family protein [Fimbriimonadales bacterium]